MSVDEMACCPWQLRGTGKHCRGSKSLNVSKCGIFCFIIQNFKNIFEDKNWCKSVVSETTVFPKILKVFNLLKCEAL